MTQPKQSGKNDPNVHTDYWKAIGNASNNAIYVIKAQDGTIIDLNSRGVELLGYPSHHAALHTVIAAHRTKNKSGIQTRLLRSIERIRTHGPQIFEWTSRHEDGTPLPIEVHAHLETINGQETVIAIMCDISKQKTAETHLRAILDASNDAIFIHDLRAGVLVDVNRRAEEMYGYTRENFIGSGIDRICSGIPPYTERSALKWVLKVREGTPQIIEWQAKHADGHLFQVEVSMRSEEIEGRMMVVASVRDISDRKTAEEYFRTIFNSSNDPIFIHDAQTWEIIDINQRAEELYEISRADLATLDVGSISINQPPYTQAEACEWMTKACSEGPQQFEWKAKSAKSGFIYDMDVNMRVRQIGNRKLILVTGRNITERKAAERQLRDSEERLRLALEAAHQGLYDLNLQTGECVVTPEYATMLGHNPKTFSETHTAWIERLHPEDRERVYNAFQDYISGRIHTYQVEFRQRTKENHWKWILSQGQIEERDEEGKPLRMLGTHTDISDRKINELKVKDSERKFKALIANLPGAVYRCVLDEKFTATFVSDGIRDICGYEPEDFTSNTVNWNDVIHPDDRLRLETAVKQAIEQNTPYEYEFRIITKDHQERWIWERGSVEYAGESSPQYIEGFVTDITERRKNAEALDSFFEQSINLHLIAGLDGTIQRVNQGWENTLGRSSEELVGSTFTELVHPDDIEKTSKAMAQLSNEEPVEYCENRYRHKDGTYRTLAWSATASAKDNVIYAVAQDITDHKQAETLAQATLDALSANIAILDHTGKIIAVNRSWEHFATQQGANPQTCSSGSNYLDICASATEDDAKDAARFAEGLSAVLAGKQDAFAMEYPCETREGLLWFTARINAFPGEDDQRVAVAHEDITARKQAEIALSESQERYRALYENAPLAYQSLNENGCFKDINPAWLKTLGYEREEVIGTWFGDYLHPDYVEHFRERFPVFKACGYVSNVQFQIRHKDGTYRRISFEGCAGYHPDGSFKQTYCVFQDITARYDAEEALRKREQEFRSLADTLPLAIYLSSGPEQDCEYLNPTFTELLGYTIEDVPHMPDCFPLAFPDEKYRKGIVDEWTRRVEISSETGEPIEPMETSVTCKDGSIKTIQWGYRSFGKNSYAYGLDLTDIRAAMEAIRESERRFSSLISNLPGTVYRSQNDAQWTIKFISSGILPLSGYTPEELQNNHTLAYVDLIHPDDRKLVSDQIHKKVQTREMYDFEYRIIAKDGTEKWVWERGAGVFENGQFSHLEGFISEITDRKHVQQQLENSNRDLRRFNHAATGRELRMIELKREINELYTQLGKEAPYHLYSANKGLSENVDDFK